MHGTSVAKGAKAKPTHLKLLGGNPGKRPIKEAAKAEAEIPKVKPDFPAHLFKETKANKETNKKANKHIIKGAKTQWDYLIKVLHPLGLITILDVPILENYIINYAYYLQAIEEVNENGFSVGDARKKNPAFSALESLHKFQKEFLIEFGMTPAARSKIQLAGTGEVVDPLDEMMNKKASKKSG